MKRQRIGGAWRRRTEPTWCPGCGNYLILEALTDALLSLKVEPWRVCVVSGIGQAGRLPHYLTCNFLHGLHGRTLAHAMGIRLANPELLVLAVAGDGDIYGSGGGHLLHAFRRNMNIACLVHNNGVYGLTKGQPSPTRELGHKHRISPNGTLVPSFNPLVAGLAAGGTFLARSYAAEKEQLRRMIVEAVRHPGFGFVDVLQPCITYDKVRTYRWYEERVYDLAHEDHDPTSRPRALQVALEWPGPSDERIPLGIVYQVHRPTHEEQRKLAGRTALVNRKPDLERIRILGDEFL